VVRLKEGTLKRIVLWITVTLVVTAMMAMNALLVNAQVPEQTVSCDPWEKAWDTSEGWWYFQWYRWCYDDPGQGGWYIDWDGWEWWGPVNQSGDGVVDGSANGDAVGNGSNDGISGTYVGNSGHASDDSPGG
jgi:hypothetical protein